VPLTQSFANFYPSNHSTTFSVFKIYEENVHKNNREDITLILQTLVIYGIFTFIWKWINTVVHHIQTHSRAGVKHFFN